MKKQLKTKQAPATVSTNSTNGLTQLDSATLEDALIGLRPLIERGHLLGSHERLKVLAVEQRIKLRLSPPTAEELVSAARKLIDQFGPTLDAARLKAQQLEANMAAVAVQRQAAAEANAKERAARLEAQRLRRQGLA